MIGAADRRALAAVLAGAALALLLYQRIDAGDPAYRAWDLHVYLQMARAAPDLAAGVERPFAYRLLGPWLAAAMPGGPHAGFLAAGALALTALAAGAYAHLRSVGAAPWAGAAAVLLLVLDRHVFGFLAWDPYQLGDALGLVATAALLVLAERGRWPAFGAVLALGLLARETPLLALAPVALRLAVGGRLRAEGRAFALAALAGLAPFAALRLAIEPAGGPGLLGSLFYYGARKLADPQAAARALIEAFLPAIGLVLAFPRRLAAFSRRRPDLVLLYLATAASALFGSDHERLMAPAALAVFPLVGEILELEIGPRRTITVLALGAVGALDHRMTRIAWPTPQVARAAAYLVGAAMAAAARWPRARAVDGVARGDA